MNSPRRCRLGYLLIPKFEHLNTEVHKEFEFKIDTPFIAGPGYKHFTLFNTKFRDDLFLAQNNSLKFILEELSFKAETLIIRSTHKDKVNSILLIQPTDVYIKGEKLKLPDEKHKLFFIQFVKNNMSIISTSNFKLSRQFNTIDRNSILIKN